MKGRFWITALVATFATMGTALAATLSNGSGQSCGTAEGVWHFVNNQTGGATQGTLTAVFTSGTCTDVTPIVLNNTMHFFCIITGTLISATTDVPGRLVLSDFDCGEPPKEPPPCDPKKEKCE